MSFLTHYPGAIPGKKRKLSLTDEEKQKKVKEYEKNRPDRKFSTKWQTDRPWLHYDGEKMSCKTCVEFFKNDKDCKNPFVIGTTNFRTSAVVDHERSNVHTKSADVINARDQTPSETMNSEAGKALKN